MLALTRLMVAVAIGASMLMPFEAAAQEPEGPPAPQTTEVVGLRWALLGQRQITIQAKVLWVDRERMLLEFQKNQLQRDIVVFQAEMNAAFACEYDLQALACPPEPEPDPETEDPESDP